MKDINAYLYPTALSEDMQSQVRERLRTRRASMVDSFLARLQEPAVSARLGARNPALQGFISELVELAESAPQELAELLSDWSPTTLLNALLSTETRSESQLDQLAGNLQALFIGRHLAGKGVSRPVGFTTPPNLYDLRRNTRLQVQGVPTGQQVEWAFSGSTLTVRRAGEPQPLATLPLPLQGEAAVSNKPLPFSKSWNVPIIEESAVAGLMGVTPQELIPEKPEEDWVPLPLLESAEAAHRIVKDLWPEVLDWSPLLFTALVDMNGPPSRSVHRSASYGPGSPILVTRVDDPFKHAEDIVHELQHQRMHLVMDTTIFGTWDDKRQNVGSPYRSDPRPMRGLHLGIHAFLAVNRLRLRQHARAGFPADRFRYLLNAHRTNLFSFRTLLEHEIIAPHGRAAFAEYARELVSQHELIEPMVDRDMSAAFDQHLREHLKAVAGRATEPIINLGDKYMNWNETAKLAAHYAEKMEKP